MIKKKILKKQKKSKRSISGLSNLEPRKALKKMTPQDLLKTLMSCIDEGDLEAFQDVLISYLDIHNKVKIAKEMGVSRTTLYNMISEDSNPTIENIIKLFQAVKKVA